jgi:hypothetical protein
MLGDSDSDNNLKSDIHEKALKLDLRKGPALYKLMGYTCIVKLDGEGIYSEIIIDWSPPNAPVKVVKAFERLLPK